mgnify:CR=1 FL=1
MVFCNALDAFDELNVYKVTILILIDGFLQYVTEQEMENAADVTILILIDGFLQ